MVINASYLRFVGLDLQVEARWKLQQRDRQQDRQTSQRSLKGNHVLLPIIRLGLPANVWKPLERRPHHCASEMWIVRGPRYGYAVGATHRSASNPALHARMRNGRKRPFS